VQDSQVALLFQFRASLSVSLSLSHVANPTLRDIARGHGLHGNVRVVPALGLVVALTTRPRAVDGWCPVPGVVVAASTLVLQQTAVDSHTRAVIVVVTVVDTGCHGIGHS